jgi:hypothetical protein
MEHLLPPVVVVVVVVMGAVSLSVEAEPEPKPCWSAWIVGGGAVPQCLPDAGGAAARAAMRVGRGPPCLLSQFSGQPQSQGKPRICVVVAGGITNACQQLHHSQVLATCKPCALVPYAVLVSCLLATTHAATSSIYLPFGK